MSFIEYRTDSCGSAVLTVINKVVMFRVPDAGVQVMH